MAEEEREAELRGKKKEGGEANKTLIAPGMTAGQLRYSRAALIEPLEDLSPGCSVSSHEFPKVAVLYAEIIFSFPSPHFCYRSFLFFSLLFSSFPFVFLPFIH